MANGHGGARVGAGRKSVNAEDRLIQKGVSLKDNEWKTVGGTLGAKKILDFFVGALRSSGEAVDAVLAKIGGLFGSSASDAASVEVVPAINLVKKGDDGGMTPDQVEALRLLKSGIDLLITGGAGVGKSWLIEFFVRLARGLGKNVLVCAPTGVAAYNVGGATIHRLFGVPVKADIYTPKDCKKFYDKARSYNPKEEKYKSPLFYADIVIIDEISMCRGDLFEVVMSALIGFMANPFRKNKNLQIIFVGDFFQLPPVLVDSKANISKISIRDRYFEHYGNKTGYAFLSGKWTDNIKICHLTTVIRQKNAAFASALNQVRIGDGNGFEWILNNSSRSVIDDAVWICGKNKEVARRNNEALRRINNKEYLYKMTYSIADSSLDENEFKREADKIVRAETRLKKGCKVVAVVNEYDNQEGVTLFVNGMRGEVVGLDEDVVKVHFENGSTIEVKPHTWEKKEPYIDVRDGNNEIKERVIATFTQIPLVLGYATTVHKSQGQTLSAINIDKNCNFTPGQLYVALSRCQSVERVYIDSEVGIPLTSVDVKRFYGIKR